MRKPLRGSALVVLLTLVGPATAVGQLLPPSPAIAIPGVEYSHEAAHDPVYNMVLFASLDRNNRQALGRFLDNAGNALGPAFVLGPTTYRDAVRVSYGAGNFLVVWSDDDYANAQRTLYSQVVSYPGGPVGPRQTIRSVSHHAFQLGLAYSPEAGQFLVAWTDDYTIPSASMMRLDLSGQPIGGPTSLGIGPPRTLNAEFSIETNSVDVVWNGVSGEFGVAYQDVTSNNRLALVLARVRIDGTIAHRVTYKANTVSTDIWSALDVNSFSGTYVAAWVDSVGGRDPGVASIDPSGVVKEFSVPTPGGHGTLDVVFSRVTGTFLLVTTSGARELGTDGTPTTSEQFFSAPFPHATALPEGKWMHSSYGVIRTIASATRSGGCVTPNPFGGGGTCYNGGWLPPGVPAPAPPPPLPSPNPGGCLTPDPFAALGGGVCVAGGWRPPTAPPPPPPPPPTGCVTSDPFISIPGMAGICINGGWIPTTLVTVMGTMRFIPADNLWAIDDGTMLHQLAGLPPVEIRVEGLQVKVAAKVRWDLQIRAGYFQVLEITTVLAVPQT